jgi:hypothetical protein
MQDTMITSHDVLEHGNFGGRQQVVYWVRRFPFSFITDREYVIARRLFAYQGGLTENNETLLYGITKV